MRTVFFELYEAAKSAIQAAGGEVEHKAYPGAPAFSSRAWFVTFPEGTSYEGPTALLPGKAHSYTLPTGAHLRADSHTLALNAVAS